MKLFKSKKINEEVYKKIITELKQELYPLNTWMVKISRDLNALLDNISNLNSKINSISINQPPSQPPKLEIKNYDAETLIRLSFNRETKTLNLSKNGIFIAIKLKNNKYWCIIHHDFLMKSNIDAFRDVFDIVAGSDFIPIEPALIKKISDEHFQIIKKGKIEYSE